MRPCQYCARHSTSSRSRCSQAALLNEAASGDPDIADLVARSGEQNLRERIVDGLRLSTRQVDAAEVRPLAGDQRARDFRQAERPGSAQALLRAATRAAGSARASGTVREPSAQRSAVRRACRDRCCRQQHPCPSAQFTPCVCNVAAGHSPRPSFMAERAQCTTLAPTPLSCWASPSSSSGACTAVRSCDNRPRRSRRVSSCLRSRLPSERASTSRSVTGSSSSSAAASHAQKRFIARMNRSRAPGQS